MTKAAYLDLLKRADCDEPGTRDLVEDLIMDEKAMAPGMPFRAALADWLREQRRQRLH